MGAKIPSRSAPKASRRAEEDDDGAPLLATSGAFDVPTTPRGRVHVSPTTGRRNGGGHAGHTSARKRGINLRTVAEACIEAGLDPAAEIARALAAQVPALDSKGKPIIGGDGKPVLVGLVDMDTKIRTLTELLQYNQHKLKAVEMKVGGSLEISDEELDQRIATLLAKAVSK